MSILDQIKKPVCDHLNHFEKYFQDNVDSSIPFLNTIVKYTIRHKGKQIRPLLVFLSAQSFGNINRSTYNAACFIELLHTATLVHDDVVDEAFERRNHFSINAIWKTKSAVLIGDYFLSRGLLLAIKEKEFEMLATVSEAVKEMSEGELLQLQTSKKLLIDLDNYFTIIRKKTASLIKTSTLTGVLSVTNDEHIIQQMRLFGEYIGISFQIRDDIFDYNKKGLIGKPLGNDLREKKFTLPLILALKNASKAKQAHIIRLLNFDKKSQETIDEIVDFVLQNNGITEAEQYLHSYKTQAINILNQFKQNECLTALATLVDYIINRNK